jgi:5-oxoprolinase (ATP-hydrolysing)
LALVGFGGAAGQHICRIANTLGIRRILDHPDAGMLSALGMGLAPIGRVLVRGIYQPLQHCPAESIDEVAGQLGAEATELLRQEHEDSEDIRLRLECDLRYQGTDAALTVELEPKSTLADRFHRAHHDTFGYVQPDRPIQLVVIRCEAILQNDSSSNCVDVQRSDLGEQSTAIELTRIWHESQWIEASLIDRHTLVIGQEVAAPAMIVGPHSTLVVEPGWTARVMEEGTISLSPSSRKTDHLQQRAVSGQTLENASHDPVLLEVITRRLQGIADAMGEVLRRTSISVNIKERRDYSCASCSGAFGGDGAYRSASAVGLSPDARRRLLLEQRSFSRRITLA